MSSSEQNGAITTSWPTIERAWQRVGGGATWVMLRAHGGSFDEFVSARHAADAIVEAEHLDPEDDEPIYSAWPAATPSEFVVQLAPNDWDVVRRWLTVFAELLADRGFTGSISSAPSAQLPKWPTESYVLIPTAFAFWTLDMAEASADREGLRRWHVADETTDRVAKLADRWARLPHAQMIVWQHFYRIALNLDDASALMARAPRQSGSGTLAFYDNDRHVGTQVAINPSNATTFQTFGDQDWRHRVDRARDALTALPADIEQGFVRTAPATAIDLGNAEGHYELGDLCARDMEDNPHLHGRYLPDAHGIQVVRTAHLEQAHDLSNWAITDLGDERHLVEAHDLEPWYSTTVPDAEVLAHARADFAGALLTYQLIHDNPSPWAEGERLRQ